ncbi:hypothetical protein [Pseudooceanicola algae]|uniref:Uncharacterized protein n=1 Tax=Pseudooceanicola algae TaxID=1537215 RepID=A0A418SIH6_9RHOB|nr:hypothetical protein [Pseudooceanicola algae]QPM91821.1 hypothetical protein PSAL_030760 [Pseudooceanicola algae]
MKRKATAILNILAWGAFWTFGLLAAAAPDLGPRLVSEAVALSGLGFLTGVLTYLMLSRGVYPDDSVPVAQVEG